jgi:peptidoglycan/xylan/chitin deacetylase (PgdA/CDA1 family)
MRRTVGLAMLVTAAAGCTNAAPAGEGDGPHAPTVVSLSFDDTFADAADAATMLEAHGMRGTFFVNSSRFGGQIYMTRDQVLAMQAAGHEIGGHTISHVHLPRLELFEAAREICNDRSALLADGFAVTSFAFPFGDNNHAVDDVAKQCGYNSARDVGGLLVPGSTCTTCLYADSIPPRGAYDVRTPDSADITTTLELIEGYVTAAEQDGGGWVPLVFHHVCDGCSDIAVSPAFFTAFLDWLAAREASGTTVQTNGEVIGGSVQPAVAGPPARHIVNGSLELDRNDDGVPDCWARATTGAVDATYATTTAAFDGKRAQKITIASGSGSAALSIVQDNGVCAPRAFAGRHYILTAHYIASTPARFQLHYRDREGEWHALPDSPAFAPAAAYALAQYRFTIPADADALSFGLAIAGVGSLTLDALDYAVERGDGAAPPITVTAP